MESVLGQTLCLDQRTFHPITRPADGGEWRTVRRCFAPAEIADLVADPEQIAGLRPRSRTRAIVVDIDAHEPAPSPYWHPDGPGASPAVQRLMHAAEAAGAATAVFRTPAGGWHVWFVLPAALPIAIAAAAAHVLTRAADIQLAPGAAECFPNAMAWDRETDAKVRKAQNGFRLPGQAGGALWVGGSAGWATDPALAWAELAAALDSTDDTTPGWPALQEAARAELRRQCRIGRPAAAPRRRHRPDAMPAWSGPGQSNANLGRLAIALWAPGVTRDGLAAAMLAAAPSCAGFNQHASADTRRRLSSWCRDWAAAAVRRPPVGRRRRVSADPGRNYRLHREAVCRVIDGARRLARGHGAAAADLPERAAAAAIGVSRSTFRKLKPLWLARVAAALVAAQLPPPRHPAAIGLDPIPKGGVPAAVLFQDRQIFFSSGPTDALPRSHSPPPHPPPEVHPVALPTKPPARLDHRRQREREELARWLGAAAA